MCPLILYFSVRLTTRKETEGEANGLRWFPNNFALMRHIYIYTYRERKSTPAPTTHTDTIANAITM